MKLRIGILKYVILLFTGVILLNCSDDEEIFETPRQLVKIIEEVNDDIITVSSIKELNAVLFKSDISVKMTPGTYSIGPDDVTSGLLPNSYIFELTGANCTYDFTDVIFEFDTAIFRSYGGVNVTEFRVVGFNNVLKNLTMNDIGDVSPSRTALNILLDGLDNRVEGFTIAARGSFPYGYGDIFGKGAGSVISHQKHSSVLIRGERNHIKNCTIIQKTYGHGIFVQGGIDTLIEGCHLFGDDTRTTDSVLAEAGTGSPADLVDFMSVWGYTLTSGWMFSKQEDGIRAYDTGSHYITGEETKTLNMRVIDCTINNFRSGVTIGFCDGVKYVENCVATGTENAFWVGSEAEVINCSGDAVYGPLYATNYQTDRDSTIDLTLIDSENEVYGYHPVMYVGGSGHKITLKSNENKPKEDIDILVSGTRLSIRLLEGREDTYYKQTADNITLVNDSNYPVILHENSSNSNIDSCTEVIDNGTSNIVTCN